MKKLFSLVLATLLLLGLSVGAYAANTAGGAGKTELVSAANEDGKDVTDSVSLAEYADRGSLSEEERQLFEEAKGTVDKAKNLTELNVRLKNVVTNKPLVVNDMFSLHADDEAGFPMKVTVKNKDLSFFVALLQYNDGKWEWINVDKDGNELSFTADHFSPYMIISAGTALPVTGRFVGSVFVSGAPAISSATQGNGKDGFGLFVITPYDALDTLPEALQAQMKDAYQSVKDAADVADLNEQLKAAGGEKTLAVSDLFDIRAVRDVVYSAKLVMDAEDLSSFVGLLHYEDGEWKWVDAEIDGNEMSFVVDSLSPFAIVVSVESSTSAKTGESVPYALILGAVLLAGASAWFFFKSRRIKG